MEEERVQDDWLENHPACEKCGGVMYPMSERYDLDFPGFTDMWYECLNCGNTVSR